MKYWSILLLALVFPVSINMAFSSELKRYTGVVEEIKKDYISLNMVTGNQINIGFVCDPEVCDSTTKYSIGDEVLAVFGAVEIEDSGRRINKLVRIRSCLDIDAECAQANEETIKANEKREIESKKYWELQLACRERMYEDLEADSRYIADTWLTRIRQLTIDRKVDFNDLPDSESTKQCVDSIFSDHSDAVIEICEKHGCGAGVGGGCDHIAGYGGTDALWVHATKQCSAK